MSLPSIVSDARTIFRAAVRRVQPDRLLDDREPDAWAQQPLDAYNRVVLVGMGKAALGLAGVAEARLRDAGRPVDRGTVVVPEGYRDTLPDGLPAPQVADVLVGGHPEPTLRSVRAGEALLEEAEDAGEDDLVIALVSGGGTALTAAPAGEIPVEDVADTSRHLLRAGIPIQQVNVVRKHLTRVGGGQLAGAAHPADVSALVVSDVVGNDLSSIASGPTVPDPSTFTDAVRILYRSGLWHDVAEPVRRYLSDGADGRQPETPSDPADFERVRTQLIGSNRTALNGAREAAERLGYRVNVSEEPIEGEAADAGSACARTIREAEPDRPTVWLWGGEPTVTVTGSGTGGRNQEVALGAAQDLADAPDDASLVVLSGGTDGIDGPTDAAGAWATPETVHRGREAGLDAQDYLDRNDSYAFFNALDQLLRPGPTHTNVMDVIVGVR
jgi:hydroxypyruvate reductase